MTNTRIMVFGTFDFFHKGHLSFFKQARALAKQPFLIVSIARDLNVKKIKNQKPVHSEKQRLAAVKKCYLVDKVLLGSLGDHLPHILKQQPNIIALGYDQEAYVSNLKSSLANRGLKAKIIRLKAFHPSLYKSSIVARKIKTGKHLTKN